MTEITQADRDLLKSEQVASFVKARDCGNGIFAFPDGPEDPALRAISKARQQGRDAALREAAAVCEEARKYRAEHRDHEENLVAAGCGECRDAILALIDKEPK